MQCNFGGRYTLGVFRITNIIKFLLRFCRMNFSRSYMSWKNARGRVLFYFCMWVSKRESSKLKFTNLLKGATLLDPVRWNYWVHSFHKDRGSTSQYFRKFYNSVCEYPQKFFEYYERSIGSFDELLELLRPWKVATLHPPYIKFQQFTFILY